MSNRDESIAPREPVPETPSATFEDASRSPGARADNWTGVRAAPRADVRVEARSEPGPRAERMPDPRNGSESAASENAEAWLRSRVAELEGTLDGIRRSRAQALGGGVSGGDGDADAPFRHLLRRLPTPLLVLAEDDTVLFANSAAVQFFGTSFGTPGSRRLADCIDGARAARLCALRADGDEDRTDLDAPDGSGPVLCHAFSACVEGYAARCLQIEWHPPAVGGDPC